MAQERWTIEQGREYFAKLAKRSKSKYHNEREIIDGITFDSKYEANRYRELMIELRHGLIRELKLQVPYRLEIEGRLICVYVADFVYEVVKSGEKVVEDSKGFRTRLYRLKKKLMKLCHGIDIVES